MKKLLKDKKGASKFYEFLMILPFAIYITTLTLYKIIGMLAYNQLNDFAIETAREAIVEENLSDSLTKIATMAYNHPNYQIIEIELINSDGSNSVKLNFSKNKEVGSFLNYCEMKNSEISFNIDEYKNSISDYSVIEEFWKIGNFYKITAYNDLSTNLFKKLVSVSMWTPEGRKTLTLGLDTDIETSNIQPISND